MVDLNNAFFKHIAKICLIAGKAILEEYEKTNPKFSLKKDSSPVTEADLRADEIIVENLQKIDVRIPCLSEESACFEDNQYSDVFWAIDPLDGTKEFLKKTGDFTVNIGLIKENKPIFGIVYAPVFDILWIGCLNAHTKTRESFRCERASEHPNPLINSKKISVHTPLDQINILTSRSHPSVKTLNWLSDHFEERNTKIIQRGSSIKICLIAEGKGHLYPRHGRTCIWDTAAGHAVLSSAGGFLVNIDSYEELKYTGNIHNPPFLASSYRFIV